MLLILAGFSISLATAQDKKEQKKELKEIKKLGNTACDCTDKIETTISKDEIVEEINKCITGVIISKQMEVTMKDMKELLKKAVASSKDTVVGNAESITLYADKNFREIQDYMMKNCPSTKKLMNSEDMLSDKSYSENPEALKYFKDAEGYEERSKYEKAIELYKKAVAIDAQFAFAWDNMGLCYRKANNYDEAIKCYQKSLEVDPYGLMPLQNMAVAYEYKKDYVEAAKTYKRMADKYPDNPEGFFGAGRAFYLSGDYEKGVDYMFKAYKLYKEVKSPYVSDAEKNLGGFWNDLKDKGKENIFTEAAKINGVALE